MFHKKEQIVEFIIYNVQYTIKITIHLNKHKSEPQMTEKKSLFEVSIN